MACDVFFYHFVKEREETGVVFGFQFKWVRTAARCHRHLYLVKDFDHHRYWIVHDSECDDDDGVDDDDDNDDDD